MADRDSKNRLLVLNPAGEIVAMNGPAAKLLGRGEGKSCWDVVGGLGEGRQTICEPGCSGRLRPGTALERGGWVRGERTTLACGRVGDFVIVRLGQELPPQALPVALTERQRQVLGLVATGHSSPEIASELGVALTTVRSHCLDIRRKLGARTLAQAVAQAIIQGQLE